MSRIATERSFIGGQLFQEGDFIPDGIEDLKGGVARSTPIGNMTDEDLEAELQARFSKRKDALDHDKDGAAGGSLTKAAIVTKLLDLKVEFDGRASRDELAKVLAKAEADAEKAPDA